MLNKKKFFALFLAVMTFFVTYPSFNANAVSVTEEKTLMKGVNYKHIEMFADGRWQDIYVVTADLSEPHLAFKVLSDSRGGSYLLNTLEMAKEADSVAAINADFFAAKRGQTGRGSAVGMEMSDGELKTTPSVAEKMNVLYQLKDSEQLFLNSFTFDITITAPNGKTDKIRHINKYDDCTKICMYTPLWGEQTPGSGGGILEVIVDDNKVMDKRWAHGPADIPENGYVLASHLSYNTFIDDNFTYGDEVKIDIKSTPNFELIENAVSGGGVLVVDGKPQTKFSHNIAGRHPRSAVGIDKTGMIVTLVAVDGRREGASGMTQAELGELMADLGCAYALNLDGGGSTLMATKTEEGHSVVNKPSDGYKRPVTNSIGIVETLPLGETSEIEVETEENVFCGMETGIKIKGYDTYHRKTEDIPVENVLFSVETGNGYVENGIFYATSPGKAIISATYGEISKTVELNILEKPHRLSIPLEDIALRSGETYSVKVTGYDKDGYNMVISPEKIKFSLSGNCAEITETGLLKAKSKGSAVLCVSYGDVKTYATVIIDGAQKAVKPQDETLPDGKQKESEITADNGFKFTVFGRVEKPKTLLELIAVNKSVSKIYEEGELHSFLGKVDVEFVDEIKNDSFTAKKHSVITHKGSTFVAVNGTNGDIFSSDSKQWDSIEKAVLNAKGGNLFVFIDKSSISWYNPEKRIFQNMMEQAAKEGTNVFVFGGGVENSIKTVNGVRYITTAGVYENLGLKAGTKDIRELKYYEVTVNGKDVTFEEKRVIK